MLDDRAKLLLKALVERYIADGLAGGFAHAVQGVGPGVVSGDDPQRHVRP
jgi:hypothetical protein